MNGRAARRWTVPEREPQRGATSRRRVCFDRPTTARDLDDALHCERTPDGGVRVGADIADVSFFVEAGGAGRGGAPQRHEHVPRERGDAHAPPAAVRGPGRALNPGVERLTFSAEWEMSAEGEVRAEWFRRGVIRSCAKLDYGTAQAVIDARDAGGSGAEALEEAVKIDDGPVKIDDAGAANGSLWDAGLGGGGDRRPEPRRARRCAHGGSPGGALRLDHSRLFRLNPGTGSPVSVFPYQTRESNHLVEEFMPGERGGGAAGRRRVPREGDARCHPPPNERKLADLEQFAREQGLEVDASSAAALHRSLARLRESHRDGYEIVQLLATLPMQLARYFSTGAQDRDTWGHYAPPRRGTRTSPRPFGGTPTCWCTDKRRGAGRGRFTPSGFRGRRSASGRRGAPAPRGGRATAAAAAADAFGLPDSETLKAYAAHCNERKLAAKLCRTARRTPTCRRTCAHRPRWRVTRAATRKYLRVFIPAFGCEARVRPSRGSGTSPRRVRGPAPAPTRWRWRSSRQPRRRTCGWHQTRARRGTRASGPSRRARRARGPYLNVSEAEHAALRDAEASASASPCGERSDDEDVFACGAPPRRLPATIRPVERVCLLLGATFPARAKPEMTAALLLRNPLAEA